MFADCLIESAGNSLVANGIGYIGIGFEIESLVELALVPDRSPQQTPHQCLRQRHIVRAEGTIASYESRQIFVLHFSALTGRIATEFCRHRTILRARFGELAFPVKR